MRAIFVLMLGSSLISVRPSTSLAAGSGFSVYFAGAPVARQLLAGERVKLGRPVRGRFAKQVAIALPLAAENYRRAVVGQAYVLAERRDGILELYTRPVISKMLKAKAKGASLGKRQVGMGAMGRPLFAENGPENTTALYRQIPVSSKGGVASTDSHTSFALSKGDAMHPFGKAGRTVRFLVPNAIFEDAVQGRAGAVGWNNLGDGYSLGIDVAEEIQIPSQKIRSLAP